MGRSGFDLKSVYLNLGGLSSWGSKGAFNLSLFFIFNRSSELVGRSGTKIDGILRIFELSLLILSRIDLGIGVTCVFYSTGLNGG